MDYSKLNNIAASIQDVENAASIVENRLTDLNKKTDELNESVIKLDNKNNLIINPKSEVESTATDSLIGGIATVGKGAYAFGFGGNAQKAYISGNASDGYQLQVNVTSSFILTNYIRPLFESIYKNTYLLDANTYEKVAKIIAVTPNADDLKISITLDTDLGTLTNVLYRLENISKNKSLNFGVFGNTGDWSSILGYGSYNTGDYSNVIGSNNYNSKTYSTLIGTQNANTGNYSTLIGYNNKATAGNYPCAIGVENILNAYGYAIGRKNVINANGYSIGFDNLINTNGTASTFLLGQKLVCENNKGGYYIGQYNKEYISNDPSIANWFAIGWGDQNSPRQNAIEVKNNADTYIYGVGGFTGANSDNASIKPLHTVINGLETKSTNNNTTISTLQSTVSNLSDKVDNNELVTASALADLDEKVDDLTDKIDNNESVTASSLNDLNDNINSLQTAISDIQTNLSSSSSSSEYITKGGSYNYPSYSLCRGIINPEGNDIKDSFAVGWSAMVTGSYSFATGISTNASGKGSFAEGFNAEASGDYSHAEGHDNQAKGQNSHVEGEGTIANGKNSHAEGSFTQTTNASEHAEGKYNVSNSNTISSIGIGSAENNRKNAFEVLNNGDIYVTGLGRYKGTSTNNADSLLDVIKNIPAKCNDMYGVEVYTRALFKNTALSSESIAAGMKSVSAQSGCTTFGAHTYAIGVASLAQGCSSIALGAYSHAEGCSTNGTRYLSEDTRYAENNGATSYSVTLAKNYNSGSRYIYTDDAVDPGYLLTELNVSGSYDGDDIRLLEDFSYDDYDGLKRTRLVRSCEWDSTNNAFKLDIGEDGFDVSISKSHTLYFIGGAFGAASHSEGYRTAAYGEFSHSQGEGTIAFGDNSCVVGKYNFASSDDLFAVGNGTGNWNNRSNALVVKSNGDVYIKGIGGYNGINSNAQGIKSVQLVITELTLALSNN